MLGEKRGIIQVFEGALGQVFVIGGIQKNDIEWSCVTAFPKNRLQALPEVALDNGNIRLGGFPVEAFLKNNGVLADQIKRSGRVVDKDRCSSPAAERFKAESAGTCKKIQDLCLSNLFAKDGKQRLSGSVGSGADC